MTELYGYSEEVIYSIEPSEDPDVCMGCGADTRWQQCGCDDVDEETQP